jgi:hypothetical protein
MRRRKQQPPPIPPLAPAVRRRRRQKPVLPDTEQLFIAIKGLKVKLHGRALLILALGLAAACGVVIKLTIP